MAPAIGLDEELAATLEPPFPPELPPNGLLPLNELLPTLPPPPPTPAPPWLEERAPPEWPPVLEFRVAVAPPVSPGSSSGPSSISERPQPVDKLTANNMVAKTLNRHEMRSMMDPIFLQAVGHVYDLGHRPTSPIDLP
jgi:hypothetical protein